jgi:integrase
LGWRNIIDLKTQKEIIDRVKNLSFHINPKIWFAIKCLSIYISVRPNELISLTEKYVDTNLGAFIITDTKEKNPKVVYLLGEDVEFIESAPRGLPAMPYFRHPPGLRGATAGKRFSGAYLYKWWKRASKELGITDVDLYGGTRHSTATALGQVCTPEEVKDATGHTSKAFERYFQGKQARALKVTKKIKELRGEVIEWTKTKSK